MSAKVSPEEAFLILSLMFAETDKERELTLSKCGIKGSAPEKLAKLRKLERAGLLRLEPRRRTHYVSLAEGAWDWAVQELGGPLPKTPRAGKLLSRVLGKLQGFLIQHEHALAEFTGHQSASKDEAPSTNGSAARNDGSDDGSATDDPTDSPAVEDEVRTACLALAHGATRQRVRLTDLRRRVTAPREVLDTALTTMQQKGKLVLYNIDNPAEITADDEAAAIFIAGNPRYLVYLEG
jgi:hypothetical protein